MQVTVSVGGRFHAFNLAQQLVRRQALHRLVTSYPKFLTDRWGIPRGKVRSLVFKEVLWRGWSYVPAAIRASYNPEYLVSDTYDRFAFHCIGNPDIFVGWSSFSLRSLRRAKERGAVGIIEHGSSHVEAQAKLLQEESELTGISLQGPHPRVIEKEKLEFEEADHISIPSSFVKRTFFERGIPESKLIHVPYGVDLSQFHQIPKTDDVFRIVFVGGMTLRKGVHYLLRACAELKLPNSELLLVGAMNDEMGPFFKRYEGSFRYIGKVPQKELYRHYSQSSVFAMCSIEEGLAMVQPQAMACGLPVIATTNTGAEDIVRDGIDGFIIPIRDVEKLKEKLTYLYEHPEVRMRMGQSAKERVSNGFTWDDYGDRIVKEYQRVLMNKKNA